MRHVAIFLLLIVGAATPNDVTTNRNYFPIITNNTTRVGASVWSVSSAQWIPDGSMVAVPVYLSGTDNRHEVVLPAVKNHPIILGFRYRNG